MLKVVVLSGFLGSGKTTLVKHILTNAQGYKVAVILNDVSQMDIDTDLVKKAGIKVKKHEDIFEMSNGCVCCTLKDDMIKEVKRLAKSKKFDYLVIEATGVSTPMPVAQAFAYTPGIEKYAQVAAMITVVDAENFLKNLVSSEHVEGQDKQETRRKIKRKEKEDQKPTLSELMIDQLEIADLVLINKLDLVTEDEKQAVKAFVNELSPTSTILETQYSKIDLSEVFKQRFDLSLAEFSQTWVAERNKTEDIPETLKYNISSFIYRSRRPFDPKKFHHLLYSSEHQQFWENITRAKGFAWLANYPRYQFQLHKAGKRVTCNLAQPWYVEMPKRQWVNHKSQLDQFSEFLKKYWEQPHGDKRIELVFICKDLNEQQVRKLLDNCLVPEDVMPDYVNTYKDILDPFKKSYMSQWRHLIEDFQKQGILLMNDDEWEEVEESDGSEEESDEEEEKMDVKGTEGHKKQKVEVKE